MNGRRYEERARAQRRAMGFIRHARDRFGAPPMVNVFRLAGWAPAEPDYCGCCGNVCPTDALWCDRCAEHVDTSDLLFTWDRTYFALHGVDCPFQAAPADPSAAVKDGE